MTKAYKRPKNKDYDERCVKLGEYIIKNNATVREASKKFGVSKSTVHKDVTDKLRRCDRQLYDAVQKVLSVNKAERHLRGGLATRAKYEKLHTK